MCSSASVSYAPPTPEEAALDVAERKRIEQEIALRRAEAERQRQQWDLWRKYGTRYLAEEEALQPLRLEAMGLRRVEKPEGGYYYERFTPEPKTEEERLAREISRLATQSQLAALRGEAFNPVIEESIKSGEKELGERMERALGQDWKTTTPGLEALARHQKEAAILRSMARKGELGALEDIARTARGVTLNRLGDRLSDYEAPSSLPASLLSTVTGGGGGGGGGLSGGAEEGYGPILRRLLQERARRGSIAEANAIEAARIRKQNATAALGLAGTLIGGIWGPVGMAIGGALGSAAGQLMSGEPSIQRTRMRRY